MAESQQDNPVPTVQKKNIPPPGTLPRNVQAWVIGGISLLMVIVIAFSGGREPKERTTAARAQPTPAIDPNEARIQEYRARIEEQARKLAAEQAQLVQTQQAFGLSPKAPIPASSSFAAQTYSLHRSQGIEPSYSAPEKSWIDTDREKREYQSLFASNIALSYRSDSKLPERTVAQLTIPPPTVRTPAAPAATLTTESGSASARDGESGLEPTKTTSKSAEPQDENRLRATARARERDAAIDRADGKMYRLFEGTFIETVLTNRLDGSFSGPVNCMVTTNVYSHDGQRLLIPQGSRVFGEVKRVDTFGQERLAVMFHRVVMPDGYSLSLDQFHGLNQIGETGLQDQVNHHYLQIFGVSLAIGAIAGLSQANTSYGVDQSAADAYRQGVSNSLSQSSLRILDLYLNVLPTFTIREGQRVKVYLSDDLLLPAYEKHQMPSDL